MVLIFNQTHYDVEFTPKKISENTLKEEINIENTTMIANISKVEIFDAIGKLVFEDYNQNKDIYIGLLSNGIYNIRVVDKNNKTFYSKFQIDR